MDANKTRPCPNCGYSQSDGYDEYVGREAGGELTRQKLVEARREAGRALSEADLALEEYDTKPEGE